MDPFKSGVIVLFCLVAVRCIDLPYRTFRCRNGTYIDDLLICDGKIDCVQPGDSLDEDFAYCDTSREECSPGTYKCAGISYFLNACRNATTRCNTIEDCLMYDEHPDEKDCGDEIKVDDCELNKGKYLCDDGLRCLDIRNTCDGFCNCFDCSDEKIECAIGEETFKSSNQACFKTPNGPFCCFGYNSLCQPCNSSGICEQNCVKFANQEKCFCNQTYNGVAGTNNARCELDNTISDSNDVAVESSHQACFNTPNGRHCCSKYDTTCQECDLNDICEQKCVVFSNRTGCFCEENYVGIPGTNNSICFPRYNAAKEKLLLYSSAHGITAINLFTKETFTVKEFEEEGCEPSLIAAARNYVYYANVKGFGCSSVSIFRVSLTTSETREIIKTDEDLTSLAIDWITNNVYYSTSESLFVCNGFGRMCETLKSGEIYSLNLAPRFGLMFWVSRIEDSNQRITCNLTRSSMDGTGEKLLLTINGPCDVLWSVDESAERIYWYDSTTEQIQSVNFNGEKRMVGYMFLPFQLQLFNGGVEFRNTQHSSLDTDLVKTTKMAFGTIFENEIFFTDVQLKEIWSFEKNFEIFARRYPLPKISDSDAAYDLTQIKAIHVFNPSLHSSKFSNPCPASCSKLCLTRPPSSENSLNHNCNNSAKETSTISMGLIVCIILAMWLF